MRLISAGSGSENPGMIFDGLKSSSPLSRQAPEERHRQVEISLRVESKVKKSISAQEQIIIVQREHARKGYRRESFASDGDFRTHSANPTRKEFLLFKQKLLGLV